MVLTNQKKVLLHKEINKHTFSKKRLYSFLADIKSMLTLFCGIVRRIEDNAAERTYFDEEDRCKGAMMVANKHGLK